MPGVVLLVLLVVAVGIVTLIIISVILLSLWPRPLARMVSPVLPSNVDLSISSTCRLVMVSSSVTISGG